MKKKLRLSASASERLLIERRRKGHTQTRAAKRYRVSLYQYRRWENGEEPPPALAGESVKSFEPFEDLFLARTRAGIRSGEMARTMGVSRWWLTQMERGGAPADSLLAYWRALRPRLLRKGKRARRRSA